MRYTPRGSGRFDVKLHLLPLWRAFRYRNLWQLPWRVKRPFALRLRHLRSAPEPVRPIWRATDTTVFLTLPFLPLQFVRSLTVPRNRSFRPARAARTDAFEKRVLGRTLSLQPPALPAGNLYVYTPRP